MAQFLKGKSSYRLQRDFPELRKKYWGQHLWSRGYFCSTTGAVTEEMIKAYIENQGEDDRVFQVWDEAKPVDESHPITHKSIKSNKIKHSCDHKLY